MLGGPHRIDKEKRVRSRSSIRENGPPAAALTEMTIADRLLRCCLFVLSCSRMLILISFTLEMDRNPNYAIFVYFPCNIPSADDLPLLILTKSYAVVILANQENLERCGNCQCTSAKRPFHVPAAMPRILKQQESKIQKIKLMHTCVLLLYYWH